MTVYFFAATCNMALQCPQWSSCTHSLAISANTWDWLLCLFFTWLGFVISPPFFLKGFLTSCDFFFFFFLLWPLEGFSSTAVAFEGEPCGDSWQNWWIHMFSKVSALCCLELTVSLGFSYFLHLYIEFKFTNIIIYKILSWIRF